MKKHSEILKCPRCHNAGSLSIRPGGMKVEYVVCERCGYPLPLFHGIPNFAEEFGAGRSKNISLSQMIMETRLFAGIYETPIWRPLHTYVSTGMTVREQQQELLTLSGDQPKEVVVDLACGTGHFTRAFARHSPDAAVFGLDLSFSMLRKALVLATRQELENILYLRGSIFELPFEDGSVDQVNCCGALHLFRDQPAIWKEVSRVLKPGGLFTAEAVAIDPKVEKVQRMIMKKRGFEFLEAETVRSQLKDVGLESMEFSQRKVILTFRAFKEAEKASESSQE